ncbi:hypothetical protein [Arcticibacter eurypsychrophilus]|uniref:hypothetical protein n=1 Tax=Arcticibacter eurypsychrophilus TaxID=1434752 RepID=UPI00084DD3EA|nr:hypothetical protein [Arcticibacter eurypsychrophilus]
MNITQLSEDIQVHCIKASSFPDGIQQAHETLHRLLHDDIHHNYFGLSWPDLDGSIIYKAAAEEAKEGELAKHSLETKTILKGGYLYIDIPDFMKDIPAIGTAFQELIQDERVANDQFCIEWYLNQNLCRCMIKTNEYENK